MTNVMTQNQRSNLADKSPWKPYGEMTSEEQRLMRLLSVISAKIHERFRNLREAFRYIDTDHS